MYSLILPALLLGVSNVFALENQELIKTEGADQYVVNDIKIETENSGSKFRIEKGVVYKINESSDSFELTRGYAPNCLTPVPAPAPKPILDNYILPSIRPTSNSNMGSTTVMREYDVRTPLLPLTKPMSQIAPRLASSTSSSIQPQMFKCPVTKDVIKVNINDTLVLNNNDQVIYSMKDLKNRGNNEELQSGRMAKVYYKGKDSKPYLVKILPNMVVEKKQLWPYTPGQVMNEIKIKREQDQMDKEEIKNLQTLLKMKGYFPATVTETGVFGPTTKQAVIDFQKSMGITTTGYVGTKTLEVLNSN